MLGLIVVWSPHCGGNCRFATLLPHYLENTFATFFGVMKRLRPKDTLIPWVQIVDDINISILLWILLLFYFFHSFSQHFWLNIKDSLVCCCCGSLFAQNWRLVCFGWSQYCGFLQAGAVHSKYCIRCMQPTQSKVWDSSIIGEFPDNM